jgi:glutamate--cysteine ligase
MEVEYILLRAHPAGWAPPPVEPGRPVSHPVLQELMRRLGVAPEVTLSGSPFLQLPGAGRFTLEPGGQIEYSSAPRNSIPQLREEMAVASALVREAAAACGLRVSCRGIQAPPGPGVPPLILDSPARMMRQTASLQVNLSWRDDPFQEWEAACRIAPYLVAVFANAPHYLGESSGHRSYRAHQWRFLDPPRTGIPFDPGDPTGAYLEFALGAGALLLGDPTCTPQPFGDLWARGVASMDDFDRHLTTVFPEVRPRGYLEFRGLDALPERWWDAALGVCLGGTADPAARSQLIDTLPLPEPDLLERAGVAGLADPEISRGSHALLMAAAEGCRRLEQEGGAALAEAVERLNRELTSRGLDPGSQADLPDFQRASPVNGPRDPN